MACVDRLMESAPDSALSICMSMKIDTNDLKTMSRWTYLYSKAEYKAHIADVDSVILEKAVLANKGRGDSLEYQTLLFKGVYLQSKQRLDSALIYLDASYELAKINKDYYYAGLAARELTFLYNALLITSKELELALLAKDAFEKAGKTVHSDWMDMIIANAYERNGLASQALSVIESCNSSTFKENDFLRESILLAKINCLHTLGRDDEVFSLYDELYRQGYKFNSYDFFLMSEISLKAGNQNEANFYFNKGKENAFYPSDSLYMIKMDALLNADKKNYREAFESAYLLSKKIGKAEMNRLQNPPINLLIDNYKLENELLKVVNERDRFFNVGLIFFCIILVIIITVIILSYRSYVIKKRLEYELIIDESKNLRNEVSGLISDNYRLKADVEEKNQLKVSLNELFGRHFELLDRICDICYHNTESEGKRISKEITETIKKLEKIDIANQLEEIINRYEDNWMKKFKDHYPDLKLSDYRLVMYLHIGLRRESIALVMGKPNVQAVSIAKYKLKKKLQSSNPESSFYHLLFP